MVRARNAYRRRRDLLLHALAAELPELPPTGADAGMQILLPLPGDADDSAITEVERIRALMRQVGGAIAQQASQLLAGTGD